MTDDDFELLSAYIDGEATPDERARVESNVDVRAEIDRLRAVAAEVAAGAGPSDPARETIIAAALAEFDAPADAEGPVPVPSLAAPRASRWMPALGAAAAAIILIGGFALTRLDNSSGDEGATARNDAALSLSTSTTTTTTTTTMSPVAATGTPTTMATGEATPAPATSPPLAAAPAPAPSAGSADTEYFEADVVMEAAVPPGSGSGNDNASEMLPADAAPSAASPAPVLTDAEDVRELATELASLPAIADARRACRNDALASVADYRPSDDASDPVAIVRLSDGRLGLLTTDDCRLLLTIES